MTFTEAEAREKACPFMPGIRFPRTPNKLGDPPTVEPQPCVASGCMAWQWSGPKPSEFHFNVTRWADKTGNYDREAVDQEAQKRGYLLPGREEMHGELMFLIYQPDLSTRTGYCCIADKAARES